VAGRGGQAIRGKRYEPDRTSAAWTYEGLGWYGADRAGHGAARRPASDRVGRQGIRKTTKTITKSTVATLVAKRTNGKPGKVTVSFDPTGPAKARTITK
jgi:hypothetical protein